MRNEIEIAARERFGEPNRAASSSTELRFGRNGSKSVELAGERAGSWFDFETEEGGHLIDTSAPVIEPPQMRLIVAKYNYLSAGGDLVMQVVRYAPKDFRQRRPDGNGNWIWSVKDIDLVPYRLPELMGASEIVICEGEKDADALMAAGIVATTKPMGSGRWPDELSRYFAGKRVYVLPDNDEAGRKTARNTAAALVGVADHVAFCDVFCDLFPKADASDWLEAGGDPDDLLGMLREFPAVEPETLLDATDVFQTIDADAMVPALGADDFVEGVLISSQMSVVYGPSNSGKTFFAADLALHVALGWRWRGLEVDQGGVLYIAAEGAYGIQNRVAAFKAAHDVAESIPFTVIPVSVNMYDSDEEMERLINTVLIKAREFGSISLVVVDTLARVMSGGDENTTVDMSQFVGHCDDLRVATKSHVMVVHHSGKDTSKGARGSSALRAATDTEIEIEAGEGFSTARVEKQRELEMGGEFCFRLGVVELGVNRRGKPVTSCVVEALDAVPTGTKREKTPRGAHAKIVYRGVLNLAADGKLTSIPAYINAPDSVRGVDLDKLFDLVSDSLPVEKNRRRDRFMRAVDQLVDGGFLGFQGDYVWPFI